MLKRLSITFLSIVFFLSCKKDAPAYPAPVTQPTTTFVLQDDVYPNPCQGTFTIKTNTTDSQNVSLFSMTGLQIINLTINGTTAIVDNNLINGIYLLHISSKHGTIIKKIVVVK